MDSEYIDIRNSQREYELVTQCFFGDLGISDRNKEIMRDFLRACRLGKVSRTGRGRVLSVARQTVLVSRLKVAVLFLRKDMDKVVESDIDRLVVALNDDLIRSRRTGAKLSASYKANIRAVLCQFFKWLYGGGKELPEMVSWLDTSDPGKEVRALAESEVQRLVDTAPIFRDKAFIQCLYDGGFRLGELLNVRLKHVQLRDLGDGKSCYFIRIPYSKTEPRTIALLMPTTRKWLDYWLEAHPGRPELTPGEQVQTEFPDLPLFPFTAQTARAILNRAGRGLDKNVYPHLLRHSSATHWARKMAYFQFCKRFGWKMNSNMPQRYIDKEGLGEEEIARTLIMKRN